MGLKKDKKVLKEATHYMSNSELIEIDSKSVDGLCFYYLVEDGEISLSVEAIDINNLYRQGYGD